MDFKEIESRFEPTRDCKCAEAENGMVATAFPDATRAGTRMLIAGGNAWMPHVLLPWRLGSASRRAAVSVGRL